MALQVFIAVVLRRPATFERLLCATVRPLSPKLPIFLPLFPQQPIPSTVSSKQELVLLSPLTPSIKPLQPALLLTLLP